MHLDNATPTAPQAVDPRPRARMSRLGRACATLVVTVVAVTTAGFMTPALAADVNGGALTMNGTAKVVSTTSVGQAGYVTFTATAGQRVQLQTSASTYTGGDPTVQLLSPTSTVLYSWTGNGFQDTVTLAAAGTYTFKATQVGANGGITFKGWTVTADSTSALTLGTAKTVTTTQGQNTSVTFTATANQRFQFQTTSSTYGAGNEPTVQLIRPDGTTVQDSWTGNSFRDTSTLPTAGTWTIKVDPPAMATGSITITGWAIANNSTGTLALNGTESNVTTSQGQNATLSFALTANQRLQLQTSASSYASNPVITVYKPDGTTVVNTWNGNAFFDTAAFATAGTYTMVIDPVGTNAGGITVQAWNVPADATSPLSTDGTPATLTTVRGQNSNGTFSLTSGQRVMIKTSENSYGTAPAVKLIAPDGSTVVQSWTGEALKDPYTVSASGSYTLLVDPAATEAGSLTAQVWVVPADQTFVAPLNGSATAIETAPGQNATASFTVTAGQRLMFQTSGTSYSSAPPVTIYRPDGTTVLTSWNGDNLTDVMTFATAGTYTLKVDPTDIDSGSMNLRVWNVPADLAVSPALNGTATVLTTTPGQNAIASIPMAANSRIMIQTTGNSYNGSAPLTLYKPDGTTAVTTFSGNTLTSVIPLATAGTYTLKLDPQATASGSITVKIWNVPADFTATANLTGTAVNVATTPGQNGIVSFAAAANQRVQIETTGNTYTNPVPVTLYAPDGTTEVVDWNGNYLLDTTRLGASAGTYTLKFDPAGVDAGSVKVQVWSVPEDADYGTLSLNGTAKTFTTVGGQNASGIFPVTTAGQRIQIAISGNTYDPLPRVYVIRPDGSVDDSWYGNTVTPTTRTFPVTGNWKIKLDPRVRSAGSIKVSLLDVPSDVDGGNLALDGTSTTLTTTTSGQNSKVSIVNNAAGNRVQLQSLGSTYTQQPQLSLFAPSGAKVDSWYSNVLRDTATLSEVGTYTLKVDPVGATTGAITVRGWSVAADANLGTINLNGTPVNVATSAGQNASMTFTGTAGDKIMFQTSGSTYAATPAVTLTRGTATVTSWYGDKLTAVRTLTASGTYKITIDPRARNAGAIVVKAWTVPADEDGGTLSIDGAAKKLDTVAGGQNSFVKFNGNAHTKIKITTSGSTYGKPVRMQLLRPNGSVVFTQVGEFTTKVITLPIDAQYKLFFNPQERDTGSIRVKVFRP